MSGPLETDVRLRSYLNAQQAARERMCAAILRLDRNYTNVRPRRPEGGPDGGRDIEARWKGDECLVGVGFQNNVSDSNDEKRQAAKKFGDDLEAALTNVPGLKAFVFFTNVDLTPKEFSDLVAIASGRGVTHCDIYWRERIAQALNQPEGLAARFQFLGLKMSDEEQVSFFDRFGSELSDIVSNEFQTVSKRLDKIEFDIWKARPLESLELHVLFRKPIPVEELGHVRVVCTLEGVCFGNVDVFLGGRDKYTELHGKKHFACRSVFGTKRDATRPGLELVPMGSHALEGRPVRSMEFAIGWDHRLRLPQKAPIMVHWTPEIMDDLSGRINYTENLEGKIARFRLVAPPYLVFEADLRNKEGKPMKPNVDWPAGDLTPEEEAVKWHGLTSLSWVNFEERPLSKFKDNWLY